MLISKHSKCTVFTRPKCEQCARLTNIVSKQLEQLLQLLVPALHVHYMYNNLQHDNSILHAPMYRYTVYLGGFIYEHHSEAKFCQSGVSSTNTCAAYHISILEGGGGGGGGRGGKEGRKEGEERRGRKKGREEEWREEEGREEEGREEEGREEEGREEEGTLKHCRYMYMYNVHIIRQNKNTCTVWNSFHENYTSFIYTKCYLKSFTFESLYL